MGVDAALWRAIAAFRIASLGYAVVLAVHGRHAFTRPGVAIAVLLGMAGWTVVTVIAYARPQRRTWPLLGADLAVACAAVLATRLVLTQAQIADGAQTLPVSWAAAPVLAWAVRGGPWTGGAAAAAVAAADLAERGALPSSATFNGVVLLLLAGLVGGYLARLALDAEARLARAVELEAATKERERLARRIHDGVLQVLALVQRRGAELGGPAAELGRLAGEQEVALRALVAAPNAGVAESGTVDLRALLSEYADGRVTVSAPADPVLLPAATARELAAAVAAALDNVRRHAGDGARAWVLVEDEGATVAVSVRDDGAGFPADRLAAAAAAGRLGVAQSIRGRVADLGGEAAVTSFPGGGTEVELRVPR